LTAEPTIRERVEPDVYTDAYYLKHCHGHEDFAATNGHRVGPRFAKALSLAGNLAGTRVLDVGCGRGELVLQPAIAGAEAWGIDYAPAAISIARAALAHAEPSLNDRMHIEQMDVKALDFDDGFFDAIFMMDVVEHLYPAELAQAFDELARVLRRGGRLIIHTSPNRFVRDYVYPLWVRRVNEAALKFCEFIGYRDRLFNKLMLPTSPHFPDDSHEREMHVNEHHAPQLRRDLEGRGFHVTDVQFWEPPLGRDYFDTPRLNTELKLLDFVRFLRPISLYAPLNRYFCHHIWMTAERR
jgi:2-polyprenyl-3-methyl-5-hydroxy-6-metoxy-1,4-benzoquinol methylase